jgi:hypothetical protein
MELKIEELDPDLNGNYYNENMYDQIPENVPVKVIKKNNTVQFTNINNSNNTNYTTKAVDKKMVRPHVPEPRPKISYDDILKKMGMFVANGQLHLVENQPKQIQEQIRQQYINSKNSSNINKTPTPNPIPTPNPTPIDHQNSYIYNKYFSEEIRDNTQNVRVPKNLTDYRNMLIHDILQKQRIKQVKSTKLIMPTSNINIAPKSTQNLNRLFSYSNR